MEIKVKVVEGVVTTTSKDVAEMFGKRHDHVLDSIKKLVDNMDFNQPNFRGVEYKDLKGENRPMYLLDRDGFTLLAMGFTGDEALKFKIAYIKAFNSMESELMKQIKIPQSYSQALLEAGRLAYENEQKQLLIEEQSKQLAIAEPKVEYFDNVLQSETAITTTIIAKEMGMSASSLNKMMEKDGIICKIGKSDQWFATAKYQNKGYVCDKTTSYTDSEGKLKTKHHTYWTESGRHFIINKYSKIKEKYNDLFNLVSK